MEEGKTAPVAKAKAEVERGKMVAIGGAAIGKKLRKLMQGKSWARSKDPDIGHRASIILERITCMLSEE